MSLKPDIKVMRMVKALDSPMRMQIANLVINASPISFTGILEHMETVTVKTISKGTLAYHLDILVRGNVLRRELSRNPDRTYSTYDTTEEAIKTLRVLGIFIEQEKKRASNPLYKLNSTSLTTTGSGPLPSQSTPQNSPLCHPQGPSQW